MERRYLDVPYKDKEKVKRIGGRWDHLLKLWWVPVGTSVQLTKDWENADPGSRVVEEFSEQRVARRVADLCEEIEWGPWEQRNGELGVVHERAGKVKK